MTTVPLTLDVPAAPRPRRRAPARARARLSRSAIAKRALNIVVALVGLILAAPLLAVIAVAVRLSSPGPVLYTQTRVGLNRRRRLPAGAAYRTTDLGGQPFTIYKFRTMRVNGHGPDDPGQVWATPDDPRVTRLGRMLRLYRLDELPQLVNVLRGDMDIVGPRPEQPAIFHRLRAEIPGYQQRQQVRPGITGWAQINQSYDRSVDDVRRKLEYDLAYVGRRSALEDLRIMMRTLPVVVGKHGAW